MHFGTNPEDKVFWYDYEFKNNDFSLHSEKVKKIKNECLEVYKMQEIAMLDLTKLLGKITSTIQAILPARRQFRYPSQNKFQH